MTKKSAVTSPLMHFRAKPTVQMVIDDILGMSGSDQCDIKALGPGKREEVPAMRVWRLEVYPYLHNGSNKMHGKIHDTQCSKSKWRSNNHEGQTKQQKTTCGHKGKKTSTNTT